MYIYVHINIRFHILYKDFICQFHIHFSASFVFHFLVLNTQSQTSAMVSFNIETLNSGANLPL